MNMTEGCEKFLNGDEEEFKEVIKYRNLIMKLSFFEILKIKIDELKILIN